jgi:hypothetical protein
LRQQVIKLLGGKCKQCGFSDLMALQIDHINGDGNKERKSVHCDTRMRKILKNENERKRFQILCANCNFIKRYTNNEHNQYGGK